MANIMLTERCNLKCPYCFAHSDRSNSDITVEDFRAILEWIGVEGERIGLIGGEPTLHKDFEEILTIASEYAIGHSSSVILFTNGINLEKYVPLIKQYSSVVTLLINLNEESVLGSKNLEKIRSSIRTLMDNDLRNIAFFSINVHKAETEYKTAKSIISDYGISNIRLSASAPTGPCDPYEYYSSIKDIYMNLIYDLKRNYNVAIFTKDCSQTPSCCLSKRERFVFQTIFRDSIDSYCEPVIDIKPNLSAKSCFGNNFGVEDIFKYENIEALRDYFSERNLKIVRERAYEHCKNCSEFIEHCNGGCFACYEV